METIKLKVLDEAGHTLMTCDADTNVSLVYTNEYHPGDRIALEIDHPGQYCVPMRCSSRSSPTIR